MNINFTHVLFFMTITLFLSCNKNKLSIPNTLEENLKNKSEYRQYVHLVNKSLKKDTLALKEIMLISNIYDGAGYEHGYILIGIMERIGDHDFNKALLRLNNPQKENVKEYFEVGMDILFLSEQERSDMEEKYPKTFKTLQLNRERIHFYETRNNNN